LQFFKGLCCAIYWLSKTITSFIKKRQNETREIIVPGTRARRLKTKFIPKGQRLIFIKKEKKVYNRAAPRWSEAVKIHNRPGSHQAEPTAKTTEEPSDRELGVTKT
jgi:hypothetical protein